MVALGLLAAIVSLRPPRENNRWARAGLVFVFAALAGLEIWAISHDRAVQDHLHEEDMREQRQQFTNLIDRLEGLDRLLKLAEQAKERYESFQKEIRPMTAEYKLKRDALLLSRNILQFLAQRQVNAPILPQPYQQADIQKVADYRNETWQLYFKRFQPQVTHICEEFKKYNLICREVRIHPFTARIASIAQDIGELAVKLH